MKYKLIDAKENDINKLIEYKENTIFEYATDLSKEEINKIKNYVNNTIPKQLNDYKIINIDGNNIGCLLIENKDDGILLNEIYIEKEYRNKGIGTEIIKSLNNDIVYLWVYKENIKAISLYKKLGFNIIEETESRYYMKRVPNL